MYTLFIHNGGIVFIWFIIFSNYKLSMLFHNVSYQFFMVLCVCVCVHALSLHNSLQPHGLQPTRLLCLWNFPGKKIGVGCHFPLQGVFLTQGSNMHLLHILH